MPDAHAATRRYPLHVQLTVLSSALGALRRSVASTANDFNAASPDGSPR